MAREARSERRIAHPRASSRGVERIYDRDRALLLRQLREREQDRLRDGARDELRGVAVLLSEDGGDQGGGLPRRGG